MLIFLDDLRKEEWFSELPNDFKKLGENDYFSFFYYYDLENTKLQVNRTSILSRPNIYIYAGIKDSEENLGYFRQPFNTKDTLFYYFLKTYIGDRAKDYILSFKEKDEQILNNESPKYKFGDVKIIDRITYQEAISKFIIKGSLINPILTLSDALNAFLMKRFKKSLYGGTIKKIVRLIKHSAEGKEKGSLVDLFLIPDENGKVRYMIVGENSEVYKNSESLLKAKEMLRLKYSTERIYQDTGWYFNLYDSKFRKVIDDTGFKLNVDLVPHEKSEMYYPENCTISIEDIYKDCVKKPRTDNWGYYIKKGYNGRLGDAFYHPTLYSHYPNLYNLPFYFAKKLNNVDKEDNYSYRYDGDKKDIVICGHSKSLESILLHEIQHAIQNIEAFSTGGNMFLASMVNEVGGGDIREFLIYAPKLSNAFCSKISDYEEINDFYTKTKDVIDEIKRIALDLDKNKTMQYIFNYSSLLKSFFDKAASNTKEELVKECYQICIYTIALYKYIQEVNNFELLIYFNKLISFIGLDKEIKTVDKLSAIIYQSTQVRESLSSKGFGSDQVEMIIFQTYLNIFGEMEARTVQNIAYLESDLKAYFLPYTSETLELKSLSVIIDKNEDYLNEKKIEAGIEKTNDDKYIIHLSPSLTAVPLIHEFGHLVFDVIQDLGMDSFIEQIYINGYIKDYQNSDEFFCDYFSAYLSRLNINENLTNDLIKFQSMPIFETLDTILNSIFNVSLLEEGFEDASIYLEYLKKFNEEI
jgi:hypothetical protein